MTSHDLQKVRAVPRPLQRSQTQHVGEMLLMAPLVTRGEVRETFLQRNENTSAVGHMALGLLSNCMGIGRAQSPCNPAHYTSVAIA
jgi:hypothetical protein